MGLSWKRNKNVAYSNATNKRVRGGVYSSLASHLRSSHIYKSISRSIDKHNFLVNQKRSGLATSNAKWKAYTYSIAIFVGAFLVAFISSSLISPSRDTNAEENTTDNVSADGYALSLSATTNIGLNLTVGPVDVMTVGQGTVNVATTSTNGYKLYIGMKNNSTALNRSGTSDTIAGTTGTIVSPQSLTRGTWGYAIPSNTAHVVTNGFSSSYTTMASSIPDTSMRFAVPPVNSANPVLIATNTSSTTGDTYPIYYGVRANQDTTEGAYSNNVLFTAIADAGVEESITVTPNSANAYNTTTITAKTTLYSTAADISADVYILTQAEKTSVDNGTPVESLGINPLTCTKTSGIPLELSCTLPGRAVGTYYIYAKSARYDKSYSTTFTYNQIPFYAATYMQDYASDPVSICSSVTTPNASATAEDLDGSHTGDPSYVPTKTLIDNRGESPISYKVKKLADGNCWMVENMRLSGVTLHPSDSNVAKDYELPASSTDGWCTSSTAECIDRVNVLDSGNTSYGTYYSWAAATAGTGTYAMASGSAMSSICPKGWRLPVGGSSGEFQGLYVHYNSVARMQGAPGFIFAGQRAGSTTSQQGEYGRYWASTVSSVTNANNLLFYGSTVTPASGRKKSVGISIHCIAETRTIFDIDYMQDVNSLIVKNTTTPATTATQSDTNGSHKGDTAYVPEKVLIDRRDGEQYRVRKLADGNAWMTENLRLTLTEGQEVEISDGSMWLPTNYDGTTTYSTTFTMADYETLQTAWKCASPGRQSCNDIVRSLDTKGSTGMNLCDLNRATTNTDPCYETSQTLDGETQKIGVYYNWYTATAGQGTLDRSTTTDISICPRGWMLPAVVPTPQGSPSYYQLLINTYNIPFSSDASVSSDVRIFPFSYIFTGQYYPDSTGVAYQTRVGGYLTRNVVSTEGDSSGSYWNYRYLKVGDGYVTRTTSRKREGEIVRCGYWFDGD